MASPCSSDIPPQATMYRVGVTRPILAARSGRCCAVRDEERKRDAEGRPLAHGALVLDRAAVALGDRPHHGEPEAGALDLALGRGRGPVEPFEEPALLALRNADPGVLDLDHGHPSVVE